MRWKKRPQTTDETPPSPKASPFHRVVDAIARHLEDGAAYFLGSGVDVADKGAVSSGSFGFDQVSGCGGWPRGRVSELVGPPGSGKTTLALAAIVEAQKSGGLAALIDVERGLDRAFAQRAGVDLARLLVVHPTSAEQAVEMIDALLRSEDLHLIVVDSVAALAPERELKGEVGRGPVNELARLMSASLRTLNATLGQSHAALLMLNQLRTHPLEDGSSVEVSAGGDALKYYAALRVEVRRDGIRKQVLASGAEEAVAQRCALRLIKNKLGPPLGNALIEIDFQRGVDKGAELLALALSSGVLERDRRGYLLDGTPIGRRREAGARLREDARIYAAIAEKTAAAMGWTSNLPAAEKSPLVASADSLGEDEGAATADAPPLSLVA